jgi:hypothetical protein
MQKEFLTGNKAILSAVIGLMVFGMVVLGKTVFGMVVHFRMVLG